MIISTGERHWLARRVGLDTLAISTAILVGAQGPLTSRQAFYMMVKLPHVETLEELPGSIMWPQDRYQRVMKATLTRAERAALSAARDAEEAAAGAARMSEPDAPDTEAAAIAILKASVALAFSKGLDNAQDDDDDEEEEDAEVDAGDQHAQAPENAGRGYEQENGEELGVGEPRQQLRGQRCSREEWG